jgi:hypothetical protein
MASQIGITSATRTLGPANTPRDIKDQREASFQYHNQYGQMLILKHRWTDQDVVAGRAVPCPFHDTVYGGGAQDCPYCFGVGILGGYANGVLFRATVADAQVEALRFDRTGAVTFERTPGLIAPWTPDLATDDLLIIAKYLLMGGIFSTRVSATC